MTTQVLDELRKPVIDIGVLAEEGVWSTARKQVLLLCALAIILDGLDNQILGFAIPSMIKEWSVARGDFAPALALGFVGMTIGTPIGGIIGDWLGRKFALIASVSCSERPRLPSHSLMAWKRSASTAFSPAWGWVVRFRLRPHLSRNSRPSVTAVFR
ncbi:hypothetical protein [Bradyrhizobium mercantei]|uniref:hypothetical protein n=1 Tax=Bradyrhizobium mercantei TaxID=1904807 RepID=UPI001FD88FDC|nr:hypothetical protein [Bradyrhizobium mercantei]